MKLKTKQQALTRSAAQNRHEGDIFGTGLDTPSGRGFIALLEAFRATGGTAPSEVVRRLLEERKAGTAVSLAKLIYTGQVFWFEWRTHFLDTHVPV